jgi:hypothetical protein
MSDSDSSEDEEHVARTNAVVFASLVLDSLLASRAESVNRQRIRWSRRVQQLEAEGSFARMYRMPLASFNKLLSWIRVDLTVDYAHSVSSTGEQPIEPEIMLHCMLRYLAGGSYLDVRDAAHISVPSFYRVLHVALRAILKCKTLCFQFPATPAVIDASAARFASCSSFGVMNGCVGCLDGMLCRIKTPPKRETRNARAYYSGHYRAVGVNVQAVCDDLCRFSYICVAAPGGTNDVRAYRRTQLKQLVEQLPTGKYVVADNAYVPTEHLLTPFSGSQKSLPANDAFNFHLSQLRIKIEQAFGFMTTKWRILRRPLQVSLRNVGTVVMAIARLHNFVISEKLALEGHGISETLDGNGGDELGYLPSDTTTVNIAGVSVLRDRIVRHIQASGLTRPQYNIERNVANET